MMCRKIRLLTEKENANDVLLKEMMNSHANVATIDGKNAYFIPYIIFIDEDSHDSLNCRERVAK